MSALVFWTDEMDTIPDVSLMDCLSTIEDPRQPSNGTLHDFREILVIALCAMRSDADSFDEIALWGCMKEGWLRHFLKLENGISSQDTFLRIFQVLDPKRFGTVFRERVGGIVTALGGQLDVDGKGLSGQHRRTPWGVRKTSPPRSSRRAAIISWRSRASLLRKLVLNLIRSDITDKAKTILRLKRKRAAWDDDIRMNILELKLL